MFNICEFIEELKNPQKGGFINSLIRYHFLPLWEKHKNQRKRIYFVGTHKDVYLKQNPSVTSVEDVVREYMCKVNEEYINLSGKMRYPYYSPYFIGDYFRCINAKDMTEVLNFVQLVFS